MLYYYIVWIHNWYDNNNYESFIIIKFIDTEKDNRNTIRSTKQVIQIKLYKIN